MESVASPGRRTALGVLLVAMATLMDETLLTRIFSVTMWYHFAFLAISVAMFGMTVGAILVYLRPDWFPPGGVHRQLATSSFLFSITIVAGFLTHLSIPFVPGRNLVALWAMAVNYLVIALPFVFGGIAIALALTRFPAYTARLYAADLLGASLGCLMLVATLRLTDGPTAVFVVAFLASLATLCFLEDADMPRLRRVARALSAGLLVFAAGHTLLARAGYPVLRLLWVKDRLEPRPRHERWNSFSRVTIVGDFDHPVPPYGWGVSPTMPPETRLNQVQVVIDSTASTPLTRWDGNPASLGWLKYEISNLAHFMRSPASVLVVGSGGGKDVLSALAFGQKEVLGVEINEHILDIVTRIHADFAGHLEKVPGVTFVNDEARSFIAGLDRRFDILQISLIDTWAATVAGAFVLTENSLYTVEAWQSFLEHLEPRGILTVSRWYFRDRPGEMYRLTSLAGAALRRLGVRDPREHVAIVRRMGRHADPSAPDGVGNMLVCRDPFSAADLDRLEEACRKLEFEIVLSPRVALDETFVTLTGPEAEAFADSYPLRIDAPTDENPFFFHMLRLRDLGHPANWEQGAVTFNMRAVAVLGGLLIVVLGLTSSCIAVPLWLAGGPKTVRGAGALMIYFGVIGLGFMFVEISQLQRLVVFLGHPTYGLAVVLATILVSSGVGSLLVGPGTPPASALFRLVLALGILVIFGTSAPVVLAGAVAWPTAWRLAVAALLLFPVGLVLGMPFALGMALAARRHPALGPWLWGINGATSVTASVLAVVISLTIGIGATFWTGTLCYAIALASYALASRDSAVTPG